MPCPSWTPPTVSQFKSYFFRDFPYLPTNTVDNPNDYVQPQDIQNAINLALVNFNSSLFGSAAQITTVFMYLAAFYLVQNLKTSARGIYAQLNFPTASAGVGGVNISFQVPDKVTKSPFLFAYTGNAYGMAYLSLVLPQTIGNVGAVGSGQYQGFGDRIGYR